jgi:short subunit dehydrogenase-like uncharacterized protein
MQREFDLVVYGASGFTGRQAAEYLVRHAPHGVRWAVAGRNAKKLEELGVGRPMIVADGRDDERLDALAVRTRVVLNMAAPSACMATASSTRASRSEPITSISAVTLLASGGSSSPGIPALRMRACAS